MSIRYSRKRPPKSCIKIEDYRFDKSMPIGEVELPPDYEEGVFAVEAFFFVDEPAYKNAYERYADNYDKLYEYENWVEKWIDNDVIYYFPDTEQGIDDAYAWSHYLKSLIDKEQEKYFNEVILPEMEESDDYDEFD